MRTALLALPLAALLGCETGTPPAAAPPDVPVFEGDFTLVDDAAALPDFAAFREDLRDVVARRDTAALLALVADGARLSFGDTPGGPEGFRQMWLSGAPPADEPVWDVRGRALAGGSVDEDGAVTVPFVPALWPSDLDPFAYVAVVERDVPAYDQPGGEVVARLSEIALPVLAPPLDGWRQVRLPDDRAAFVEVGRAISPVGYRAVFWDDGEGWRLRSFLAGD